MVRPGYDLPERVPGAVEWDTMGREVGPGGWRNICPNMTGAYVKKGEWIFANLVINAKGTARTRTPTTKEGT